MVMSISIADAKHLVDKGYCITTAEAKRLLFHYNGDLLQAVTFARKCREIRNKKK